MEQFRVALSGDFKKPDGSPSFPEWDLSPLEQRSNLELIYLESEPVISARQLEGLDALILLSHRIAPDSFPGDGRLAAIARFGVGYDNVDVPACNANGCALIITPDGVRRPVAVSILTLIFALTSKLIVKDRIARQGPAGWAEKTKHNGVGLVGKTLGSLGIGNIGAELFRLAAPLDMNFIANDPYADAALASSLGVEPVDLDELFRRSDILCINCPLNDSTHHIVDADRLALMKPTSYLVNTARGPIVDQAALTRVLQEGRIAGAGLDVLETEPPDPDDPILALDNAIITPHALCWTDQIFEGNGNADTAAVLDVMSGRIPTGIVNREVLEDSSWRARIEEFGARYT